MLEKLNSTEAAISKVQHLILRPAERYYTISDVLDGVQSWESWSEFTEVCREGKIKLSVGSKDIAERK